MDMDTGQYLCVHVSDKEQPSFFGIKPIFYLCACTGHLQIYLGAVCSAVLLSLSLHGLFEEKTKTKPRTKPIDFPASKAAASVGMHMVSHVQPWLGSSALTIFKGFFSP